MSSETLDAAMPHLDEPVNSSPTIRPRSRRRGWVIAFVALIVTVPLPLAFTGLGDYLKSMFAGEETSAEVYTVEKTVLDVTLEEEGELKPVDSVELKCEVQNANLTIQWIVEESTIVKEGDVLVRLASDELKDRVETEEMQLRSLAASLEEAKQALKITRSEGLSTIKKAEIDLAVAELELKRYIEGDYPKSVQSNDISIAQTEIDIRRKEDDLAKSKKLLEKKFISQSEIDELEASLEKLKMTLRLHKLERGMLDEYELPKNQMQKESAVERAREELEREKQRAASRERQAMIKVEDQEQTLTIRQQRFERMRKNYEKCTITAPSDGIVQYGAAGRRRWWDETHIAVGQRVHDGQTLITLPDTSQMMVTTRVHEADRHKLSEDLPCLVRLPAVPDTVLHGKLSKIAKFADSEGGWLNPGLKEHAAEVLLDQTDAPVSPGDTAHVEILIERVPDVLAVPVQCVYVRGTRRFVFVQRGGSIEPVEVKVGRTTTAMIEVTEGLAEGDKVLLAPDDQTVATLPTPKEDEVRKPIPTRTGEGKGHGARRHG